MNDLPQYLMDRPAFYRIRVHGRLKPSWIEAMWGSAFAADKYVATPDQTVFISEMADQAALVGCINALYNLGHAIISIAEVGSEEQANLEEQTAIDYPHRNRS
jgi:hypothetical protein